MSIVFIAAIIEMMLFFLGQLRESLQLYLSSLQAKLEEDRLVYNMVTIKIYCNAYSSGNRK